MGVPKEVERGKDAEKTSEEMMAKTSKISWKTLIYMFKKLTIFQVG